MVEEKGNENELKLETTNPNQKLNSFSGYINCHLCRRIEESKKMLVCSNLKCNESFCMTCIRKFYSKNKQKYFNILNNVNSNWVCIVCTKQCTCKTCKKLSKQELEILDNILINQNMNTQLKSSATKTDVITIPFNGESVNNSKSVLNSSYKEEPDSLTSYLRIADEYKNNISGKFVHKKCSLCSEKKFFKQELKKFRTLNALIYYLNYMIDNKKFIGSETADFTKNKEEFKEYTKNLSNSHKFDYKFHAIKNICIKCLNQKFSSENGFKLLCGSLRLPELVNNSKIMGKNVENIMVSHSDNSEILKDSILESSNNYRKTSNLQTISKIKANDNYEIISTSSIALFNPNKKLLQKDQKVGAYEITYPLSLSFQRPSTQITSENIPNILQSLKSSKMINTTKESLSTNPENSSSNLYQELKSFDCKEYVSLQYYSLVQKSFINLLTDNLSELSEQLYNNQIISELVINNLIKQISVDTDRSKEHYNQNLREQLLILKKVNDLGLLSCSNMKSNLKEIESSDYSFLIKNHEKYQDNKNYQSSNPVCDKSIPPSNNNLTSMYNENKHSNTNLLQPETRLDQHSINTVAHAQNFNNNVMKNFTHLGTNEYNLNLNPNPNISLFNKSCQYVSSYDPNNNGCNNVYSNSYPQQNIYNTFNQQNLQYQQSYNYPNLYNNQQIPWNNLNNYSYSNSNNPGFYNNLNYQPNITEITNHLYNTYNQNNPSVFQHKPNITGEIHFNSFNSKELNTRIILFKEENNMYFPNDIRINQVGTGENKEMNYNMNVRGN